MKKNVWILVGAVLLIAGVWYMNRKEDEPSDSITDLKDPDEVSASPSTQFPFEVIQGPRVDSEDVASQLGMTADQPWYNDALNDSLDDVAEGAQDVPVIPEELEQIMEEMQ